MTQDVSSRSAEIAVQPIPWSLPKQWVISKDQLKMTDISFFWVITGATNPCTTYLPAEPKRTFRGRRILSLEEFSQQEFPYPPESHWDEE